MISVVIPALNEEEAIVKVVREIPAYISEVIVADNGSSDSTAEVARKAGAKVIFEKRRGYGYACLAGISALSNPDVVVFLDGDYSDYPEDIPLLLEPIEKEGYDFVVGSRIERREKGSMPPHAVFANLFFGFLIWILYGTKFTDLGPLRAIRYSKLLELDMQDKTFGWTAEMQVKAAKKKLKIKEVQVRYRKRIGESKVTGSLEVSIRAGLKILWTIFRHRF